MEKISVYGSQFRNYDRKIDRLSWTMKPIFLEELKIFRPKLCKTKIHNWPEVEVKKDVIPYDCGMHYYLRYVLTLASLCGVFPVQKIYRKNINALSFSWFSILTVYSFLLLLGFLTIEIFSLDYTAVSKKPHLAAFSYGNACIAMCLFVRLAKKWPKLVSDWKSVEMSMIRFGTPKLGWKVAIMTSVLFTLAFAEHGLHNWLNTRPGGKDDIASMAHSSESPDSNEQNQSTKYLIDQSLTFRGYLERFSLKTHWYLFNEPTDYNVIKGFIIMWLSLSATFLWNFTDLFIMLISSALAAQFHMLTKALKHVRAQVLTLPEWREFRETYTLLTHLVKNVDDHINSIIVLSVANNVYFICAQLITEIDSIRHSYFRTLFYMYSFLFLVFRTTAVVMQAAAIHDESKLIVPELFLCPTKGYCAETQRFLHEVTADYVALTGLNMFSITRNFLLGVAGAILTYEIVLIQLQNKNSEETQLQKSHRLRAIYNTYVDTRDLNHEQYFKF